MGQGENVNLWEERFEEVAVMESDKEEEEWVVMTCHEKYRERFLCF